MDIGQRIKNARIAKDLTQEQLGELIGVQKSAIAKYESGRVVNIKRSTLKKLSDILDIRPSELIFNAEEVEKKAEQLSDTFLSFYDDEDLQSVIQSLIRIKANDPESYKNISALIKGLDK